MNDGQGSVAESSAERVVAMMTSTMRTLGQDAPRVGERRPREPLWKTGP